MRLRFTIRDLLWLTLVVALAVGWWIDHRNTSEIESKMHVLEMEIKVQRLNNSSLQQKLDKDR